MQLKNDLFKNVCPPLFYTIAAERENLKNLKNLKITQWCRCHNANPAHSIEEWAFQTCLNSLFIQLSKRAQEIPTKFIVSQLFFVKKIDLVEGNIDKIVATQGNAVAAQGNNSKNLMQLPLLSWTTLRSSLEPPCPPCSLEPPCVTTLLCPGQHRLDRCHSW